VNCVLLESNSEIQ